MFNLSVLMAGHREAFRANAELLRNITPGQGGAADAMLANIVLRVRDAAHLRAPRLTGTLAFAHRGEILDPGKHGLVYIDPSVRNPVFGGFPAEYGLEVHSRKPWMALTVAEDAPRIIEEEGGNFIATLGNG